MSKRDGDRLGFPVFPLEWHVRTLSVDGGSDSVGVYGDGLHGSRNLGKFDQGRWPAERRPRRVPGACPTFAVQSAYREKKKEMNI